MSIEVVNHTTATATGKVKSPSAYLKSITDAKKIGEFFTIPLSALEIYPNFNKRTDYKLDELKLFIEQNSVSALPAIKLMYIDGKLYVEEGHRRQKACVELDLPPETPIKVFIGEPSSSAERLARQISSNSGEKYNFVEMVAVVKELIQKEGMTQTQVAKMIGKTQGSVSQMSLFFNYSNLLLLEIQHGSIKYTRVMELQKSGYTEEQILEVIKKSTHNSTSDKAPVPPINPDSDKLNQLLGDDHPIDDKNTSGGKRKGSKSGGKQKGSKSGGTRKGDEPVEEDLINAESLENPEEDLINAESLENSEEDLINAESLENSEEDLINAESLENSEDYDDEELKKAVILKDSGVAPNKPTATETSIKKVNVKLVLVNFFIDAKIVDNGDGTVSYNITQEQHAEFQRNCMNIQ
jgi:hypothetical protein